MKKVSRETSIGNLIRVASRTPNRRLLIDTGSSTPYVLMPLDDDLIDEIVEHDPELVKNGEEIQKRMDAGQSHTLEDVMKMFAIPRKKAAKAFAAKRKSVKTQTRTADKQHINR